MLRCRSRSAGSSAACRAARRQGRSCAALSIGSLMSRTSFADPSSCNRPLTSSHTPASRSARGMPRCTGPVASGLLHESAILRNGAAGPPRWPPVHPKHLHAPRRTTNAAPGEDGVGRLAAWCGRGGWWWLEATAASPRTTLRTPWRVPGRARAHELLALRRGLLGAAFASARRSFELLGAELRRVDGLLHEQQTRRARSARSPLALREADDLAVRLRHAQLGGRQERQERLMAGRRCRSSRTRCASRRTPHRREHWPSGVRISSL